MVKNFKNTIRKLVLKSENVGLLKRFMKNHLPKKLVPIFLCVTPNLVHIAPLAVRLRSDSFQPIFIANGLTKSDLAWLSGMAKDAPIVPLRTSLTNNPSSLLSHGTIIEYLIELDLERFCKFKDDFIYCKGHQLFVDLNKHGS